jgi:hypothetical protein
LLYSSGDIDTTTAPGWYYLNQDGIYVFSAKAHFQVLSDAVTVAARLTVQTRASIHGTIYTPFQICVDEVRGAVANEVNGGSYFLDATDQVYLDRHDFDTGDGTGRISMLLDLQVEGDTSALSGTDTLVRLGADPDTAPRFSVVRVP